MKNDEMLKLAEAHLGQGGGVFRRYCGMSGGAWCCAFVTYMFHEGDASPLFYGGKKVVYCPTAIQWCKAHLAQIPIYLALPMDIVFFDWNANNVPDHIGFAVERLSDQKLHTIEGNTSGGIVAEKTRPNKYILGCFRPHYKAKYDTSKALVIDGCFGNNSIACLQKALGIKVDGILGKDTVKALQKKVGVAQDGAWGIKTSKAIQKKLCGFKGDDIDGAFGVKSVKALQKWINKQNKKAEPKKTEPKKETAEPKTQGDKIADNALKYAYSGEPKESKYPSGQPKPEYKEGLNKAFPKRPWGDAPKKGASCDVFVATCARNAGDKLYPRGLAEQEPYLKQHYTKISYDGDKSVLRDGDIGVMQYGNSGHTFVIIKRDGKIKICEANYKSTYGITVSNKDGVSWRLKHRTGKDYCHIFRAK